VSDYENGPFEGLEFRDSKEAFIKAIEDKRLTRDPDDENYAGNYMYMHTQDGIDQFKNIITRKYDV